MGARVWLERVCRARVAIVRWCIGAGMDLPDWARPIRAAGWSGGGDGAGEFGVFYHVHACSTRFHHGGAIRGDDDLGYWRLVVRPAARGWGRAGQLEIVVGSIGIFYTHYYSVLLLAALGVWHLLMMPKDRRWWRPVLLWGAGRDSLPAGTGGFPTRYDLDTDQAVVHRSE